MEKENLLAEELQKVFVISLEVHTAPTANMNLFPAFLKGTLHYGSIKKKFLKYCRTGPSLSQRLPLCFIQNLIECIAFPLELIFNMSYMKGDIPRRWSHSFVTPSEKKNPLYNNPGNYRPISITSLFARTFEKNAKRHTAGYRRQRCHF